MYNIMIWASIKAGNNVKTPKTRIFLCHIGSNKELGYSSRVDRPTGSGGGGGVPSL